MGHGPPFDSMAQKHQMSPTVFQNYPGVSMAQPVTSAPPPYETHAFNTPQLPSKFPSKVSPREAGGGGQSSSVENLNKSSDSAPMSQIAKGTKIFLFLKNNVVLTVDVLFVHAMLPIHWVCSLPMGVRFYLSLFLHSIKFVEGDNCL